MCVSRETEFTKDFYHCRYLLPVENSQHRPIDSVAGAQYGHIGGIEAWGHTSRSALTPAQSAWQPLGHQHRRTQPDVWPQRLGMWAARVSAEEEAASLPHHIHQFPAGGAGEGLLSHTLPRRIHQVSSVALISTDIYALKTRQFLVVSQATQIHTANYFIF